MPVINKDNADAYADHGRVQRELLGARTEALRLQALCERTQVQLDKVQHDLDLALRTISSMQGSAFWKMRNAWMRVRHGGYPHTGPAAKVAPPLDADIGAASPPDPADAPATPDVAAAEAYGGDAHGVISRLCRLEWEYFLASKARLEIPCSTLVRVSVILVTHGRAEFLYRCLRALCEYGLDDAEVIIVDNASAGETQRLLTRLDGARIIRNVEPESRGQAVDRAVQAARGEFLLLLDGDAQVMPGAIEAALTTIGTGEGVGAVGAKIISPTGSLLEAGGGLTPDGRCLSYGRGDAPDAAQYCFRRDVAYCSQAFLLTARDALKEAGGFGRHGSGIGYCAYLRAGGARIVYEPASVVLHLGDAGLHEAPTGEAGAAVLRARTVTAGPRALVVDDRVPHEALGAGFPRARQMLLALDRLGYLVTVYPTAGFREDWSDAYQDIPRQVELMLGPGREGLAPFLEERRGYYDVIIISRPGNMALCLPVLRAHPEWLGGTRVVYDAEAIFAHRTAVKRRLEDAPMTEEELLEATDAELSLARGADAVLSVSAAERELFSRASGRPAYTVSHVVAAAPTPRRFEERSHILFVGALHSPDAPNVDSVFWFAREVMPLLRAAMPDVEFLAAGPLHRDVTLALSGVDVQVVGQVDDLTPYYDAARIFVAPTRFAAGIPLKVLGAAAHGLPVVCTPLLATQLGWEDGRELLTADAPETFAAQCLRLYREPVLWEKLRRNALKRVEAECSMASFTATLAEALTTGEAAPKYPTLEAMVA